MRIGRGDHGGEGVGVMEIHLVNVRIPLFHSPNYHSTYLYFLANCCKAKMLPSQVAWLSEVRYE